MHVTLYCDGGSLGKNPSPTGVYWSIARQHDDGRVERLVERATSAAYHSNNCAEYLALGDALRLALGIEGLTSLSVHSDSQLVVSQFNRIWKVREKELRPLCAAAHAAEQDLIARGVSVTVVWSTRGESVKRLGH
jgi:ribonuclease HI